MRGFHPASIGGRVRRGIHTWLVAHGWLAGPSAAGYHRLMLLAREEMRFDVATARFDLDRDRELLTWIFSQALFGEATGCYCGASLYTAPDIESATFLSRQAVEEFAHFRNFLKIFRLLGTRPQPPHPVIRMLTSHEPVWEHHVCLEMAIGEGLVLMAFDAFIDTIDDSRIKAILRSIAAQEVGHVEFGERQTLKVLARRPGLKRQLLGRALLTIHALRWLARRIGRWAPKPHPVMDLIPRFLDHTIRVTEERMKRLGLLRGSLKELGPLTQGALIAGGVAAGFFRGLFQSRKPRIPANYLDDPVVDQILGGEPEPAAPIARVD